MNFSAQNKDYLPEIAFLFFLLLFTYFIKFSNFVDFDFTPVGWSVFAIHTLIRVKLRVIFKVGVLHLVLLIFYAVGVHMSDQPDGWVYGRVIITSFFLTSAVLGLLTGSVRVSLNSVLELLSNRFFIFSCYALLAYWAIFILNIHEIAGAYLVKDYGGANYLTTSDLLAMYSLVLIGSTRTNIIESVAFALITIVVLALLGSRASIVLFVFCYLLSIKKFNIKRKIIAALLLIPAVVYGLSFVLRDEFGLFFRFNTIFALNDDESRGARSELMSIYFRNLIEDPACVFLPCHPVIGGYVHNILSVHQYFGLIVWVALLVIFLASIIRVNVYFRAPYFSLLIYSFVQVLFFRSWVSLVFPVFLAFVFLLAFRQGKRGG